MNATATASEYGVPAGQNRWLGIDFSGDKRKWSAGCSRSNVWIAVIRPLNDVVQLVDLRRVQELFGDGSPFELLTGLLAKRSFLAAAIDAPFSVPSDFLPKGSHTALLDVVAELSLDTSFPDAQTFADAVIKGRRMAVPKPLRETERMWQERGLNVRSTLWTGARGGAAMTAVCLSLLAKAACPMWPWSKNGPGLLAEAFPAAQLLQWRLPFQRYNNSDEISSSNRRKIVSFLENERLEIGEFKPLLLSSADALDSVLCTFAAKAVWNGCSMKINVVLMTTRFGQYRFCHIVAGVYSPWNARFSQTKTLRPTVHESQALLVMAVPRPMAKRHPSKPELRSHHAEHAHPVGN